MASGVVLSAKCEGKGREAVHIHHDIEGQPVDGADEIVVWKFHVRRMNVSVVLEFVVGHR